MQTVTIIGVGRIGGSIAAHLPTDRYQVIELVTKAGSSIRSPAMIERFAEVITDLRQIDRIDSDICIIAVPDGEIRSTASSIVPLIDPGVTVFHTSGALSSSVIVDVLPKGVNAASLHPLASVSRIITEFDPFEGVYFGVEGDGPAVELGKQVAMDLGGNAVVIRPDAKYLYHAAAVMAAGHVVALMSAAFEAMKKSGAAELDPAAMLLPLVESTIQNLRSQLPSDALTGTFARADHEIAAEHIRALRQHCSPEVTRVYLDLGLISLDLALQRGADAESVEKLRKLISVEMSRFGC